MEDNTGSRESKKKSMEDNTRSSESKEKRRKTRSSESREERRKTRSSESKEKRRKSMEDNTRSSESKEKKRKSMEDNTPTENSSSSPVDLRRFEDLARMANPPLRWAGSSPHVEPGQNIVLVRPKPLRNPRAPMEADDEIIEEKAVCKVCFAILREEGNILKTKCKCGNALIHETCVADGNNNCDYCEQEVQTFPVTLVRGLSSSTPAIKKKAKNVFGRFHG